jgi:hypothetical protein
MSLFDHVRFLYESELFQDLKQLVRIICILISGFILSIIDLKPFFKSNLNFPPVHNTGSRSNRPQTKSAPSQIGPRSNHCIIMFFLFNLIICIVNYVVYLIPNQIIDIVLLCCLFNLII